MCGRFTLTRQLREIQDRFEASDEALDFDPHAYAPNINVAPTEQIPIVAVRDGVRRLMLARWGLIPRWAKDARIGARMINARDDTLAEKPAFSNLLENHTCLVVADGFMEFERVGQTKRPVRFVLASKELFAFAGLWVPGHSVSGQIPTCTIITTDPNTTVSRVHNRMPVILERSLENAWLNGSAASKRALLKPCSADSLVGYYVNPGINSVRQKSPDLLDEYRYEDLFSAG